MRTLSAVPTTYNCVQIYLSIRDTSLYRTANWVPMVSTIDAHTAYKCTITLNLG